MNTSVVKLVSEQNYPISTDAGIITNAVSTGDSLWLVAILLLLVLAGAVAFVKLKKKFVSGVFVLALLCPLLTLGATFGFVGIQVASANQSADLSSGKSTFPSEIIGIIHDDGTITFNNAKITSNDEWGISFGDVSLQANVESNSAWHITCGDQVLFDGKLSDVYSSVAQVQPNSSEDISISTNMQPDESKQLAGKEIFTIHYADKDTTRYISHAGVHLNQTIAGQNSLESMRLAKTAGFDFMEVDVRLTADNQLVAMHNPEINNTMRMKENYQEIPSEVLVQDITLAQLQEKYVFKTENEAYRTCAPSLQEFVDEASELGITLMIHPKTDFIDEGEDAKLHDYVDRIIDVCHKSGNYIVSESRAVDYALSVDPNIKCMRVVKTVEEADEFAQYPNCVLAVSYKHDDYDNFAAYCKNTGHHVESTLNTDVRENLIADTVNYDYLSPARFEQYSVLGKVEGQTSYEYSGKVIQYGTAQLRFKLTGDAKVECGWRKYENLHSDSGEYFKIPILLYGINQPNYTITTSGAIEDIQFIYAEHPCENQQYKFSGHRGCQSYGPENSFASFEAAAKRHMWAIETDFRMTKDRQVICMHDATIDRTIVTKTGNVSDYTLAELQEMEIADVNSTKTIVHPADYSYDNLTHHQKQIPTMEDYFRICSDGGCIAYVELKEDDGQDDGIIAQMMTLIEKYNMQGKCYMSSSKFELLKAYRDRGGTDPVHKISGNIDQLDDVIALKTSESMSASIAFNYKTLQEEVDLYYHDVHITSLKQLVDLCHANGVQVCFRAVDDIKVLKRSRDAGIDYYPTNQLW